MNIFFKSSRKNKNNKSKILDLINFKDLLSDKDILLYDDNENTLDEDYDYDDIICDDKLNIEYDFYNDDTIYYL